MLLQVVCQVLETYFASFHVQLEVVDSEKRNGLWMALLALNTDNDVDQEAVEHVLDKANKMFCRGDELTTCVLENVESGLVSVRITDSSDFIECQ